MPAKSKLSKLQKSLRLSKSKKNGVAAGGENNGMGAKLSVTAFGQTIAITALNSKFLQEDSDWRLRHIYEPFLATLSLDPSGIAIDIGAGFGAFAIPFALAYPDWKIWCFEPDPDAAKCLAKNVKLCGADNLVMIDLAVGATEHSDIQEIEQALKSGDIKKLGKICSYRNFQKDRNKPGYIEAVTAGDRQPSDLTRCKFKTIPAKALLGLKPTLLKLTAPGFENAILTELNEANLNVIVGETWRHLPTNLIYSGAGARQTWLPRAGHRALNLRRAVATAGRVEGLDVAVAMYNAKDWIIECVSKIVERPNNDIRAIVVDDGSSDGCGDLVRKHFSDNPRVVVHKKRNGGCASARNYGRLMSDRCHIAFVDADDVPDADLFPELLELSRYTGAEITQGEFDLLAQNDDGLWSISPSGESDLPEIKHASRIPFGDRKMLQLPSKLLIESQPTIWRRVYRRDFLDNKNIWFPEHIRAFDDQIFQLLTLQYAGHVPTLEGVAMHYRQHPSQDIRQGDERGFYSLEMFRTILKRSIVEGWNDVSPILRSFINTFNWTYSNIRGDLKPIFMKSAAEFWAYAHKSLGQEPFTNYPTSDFVAKDFDYHFNDFIKKLHDIKGSYVWAWFDSTDMHASMVKNLQKNAD